MHFPSRPGGSFRAECGKRDFFFFFFLESEILIPHSEGLMP